jgi:hypothetical protein
MYFYCYHCWSDFEEESDSCPKCGKELSSFSALNFHEKLIRALDHPERLTLQRAIWIIGNLRLEKAVPKLSILAKDCQDFVIVTEIINTLIKIGTSDAIKIVEELPTHTSSIVRKYASEALNSYLTRNFGDNNK